MSTNNKGGAIPRQFLATPQLWDAVREIAHRQRRSMSEIVREALEAHPDVRKELDR